MLLRYDVFDVECDKRLSRLGEATILATALGSLSDASSRSGVHQAFGCLASTALAFACKILMTSMAST